MGELEKIDFDNNGEYIVKLQELVEVDRNFRVLEECYERCHRLLDDVESKINNCKKQWWSEF